ncbi:hypothetical protein [Actinoallomurus sp. NPDC050550]|uniref:hypothetical protein n=1 Tax=Actinoallomurus sp. NPDC050550 TaxID=3154937 RepID=UPI00340EBD30
MSELLASAVVDVNGSNRASELEGTLFDGNGTVLATVDEPGLSRWQRVYRAGYTFANRKQGVRPLGHRLEVRGAAGEPLFSIADARRIGPSRRRIRVLGPDGSPVGAAEQAWRNPIRGRFRLVDAHRGALGELRPLGRLALRYSVVDSGGVEVAQISRIPVTTPQGGGAPSRCHVTFGDVSDPLRVVVLGCAIALQLMV